MPNYFVDNVTGNDQYAGDQAHPFAKITKAVSLAKPGDTIKVVPTDKPYTDYFAATSSGASGSPITITSATVDKPRITPGSSWVFTGDYWVVENFDFYGFKARPIQIGGSPLSGLGPDNDFADHIIVRDCLFRHATQEALWICHTTDTRIERCTFRDVRRRVAGSDCCALCVYGGSGVVVADSLFEDIGSDGVHVGPKFHEIGAVVIQGCTFRVNRPYGSQPWQNWSSNVGENGIDVKGFWSNPLTDPALVGPVLVTGCVVSGFYTIVSGQDCSDSAGHPGTGITAHMNATPVSIEDTIISHCDIGLRGANGSGGGTTYDFHMSDCVLHDLDEGIVVGANGASVAIHGTRIFATKGLEVHSSNLTFKNNVVDAQSFLRAAQTGYTEVFASNRWLNALPPTEWRSSTDTTKPGILPTNDLAAIATELDTSANNLRQQAALLAAEAAAIRATAEKLQAA